MILHLFFSYCYLIQYNNMTESEIKVPQKRYDSCLNLEKKVSRFRFEFREKSMYHVKWNWDEYQYQCHNVPPTRTKSKFKHTKSVKQNRSLVKFVKEWDVKIPKRKIYLQIFPKYLDGNTDILELEFYAKNLKIFDLTHKSSDKCW